MMDKLEKRMNAVMRDMCAAGRLIIVHMPDCGMLFEWETGNASSPPPRILFKNDTSRRTIVFDL